MIKQATKQDILDINNGHVLKGQVSHTNCGGKITFSFMTDNFICIWCSQTWGKKMVESSTQKDPHSLYYWAIPMETSDENL